MKMPRSSSQNYHLVSAATNNAHLVRGAAVSMTGFVLGNSNSAARYVKFYDKATAPVPGTDAPKMTILVPPAGVAIKSFDTPLSFNVGLGISITAAMADNDNTSVGAGDVVAEVQFTGGSTY